MARKRSGEEQDKPLGVIIHVTTLIRIDNKLHAAISEPARRLERFLEYCSVFLRRPQDRAVHRLLFHLAHLLRFRVLYICPRDDRRYSANKEEATGCNYLRADCSGYCLSCGCRLFNPRDDAQPSCAVINIPYFVTISFAYVYLHHVVLYRYHHRSPC